MSQYSPIKLEENLDVLAPECNTIPGLDSVLGLQNVGGKPNIYLRILYLFAENHATDAVKLQQVLLAGDLTKIELLAHALKGVSGTLGAVSLHLQAALLEEATRSGRSITYLTLIVDNLAAELTHLISAIFTLLSLESRKVKITLNPEKHVEIVSKLDSLLAEDNGEAVKLFTEFRSDIDVILGNK